MKELIERLRQKAGQYDEYDWHSVTELEAAAALERMVTELETANRIKTEQIDYAIGLQISIEAHCREELAPEDVCPHHAEKLNEHFNRQQVLEKEHTEFYSEVVTLRSTVEHLRLRENRLTAERDALREGLDGWHSRYLDCEVERDALKEQMTTTLKVGMRCAPKLVSISQEKRNENNTKQNPCSLPLHIRLGRAAKESWKDLC